MKIYNYHPVTKEFLSASLADESPLEKGVYLIPAYSTKKKPPKTARHETAVFNQESDSWIKKSDYRGSFIFDKKTGQHIIHEELGDIPEGYTTRPFPDQDYVFDEERGDWYLNPDKRHERLALYARSKRNSLLRETDWTQLPDVPPSTTFRYVEYRELLRDITNQTGFPHNINWPQKP